ncbi:MAG: hypothetical protein KGJ78_10575 [Alphaproteobacteria bacterium]|nr:hypothetical protein [Alphaproteobacteria bacterium]
MSDEDEIIGAISAVGSLSPIMYAMLIGGALLALIVYFFRYNVSVLEVVSFGDIILFTACFALCGFVLSLLIQWKYVGYVVVPLLFAVSLFLIVQVKFRVLSDFSVPLNYYLISWGVLAVSSVLGVFLLLNTGWLPFRVQIFLNQTSPFLIGILFALGGYVFALFNEANFYEWRNGAPAGYRTHLVLGPSQLAGCACGVGIIWLGDRTSVLKCADHTYIVRNANALVFEKNVERAPASGLDAAADRLPPLSVVNPTYLDQVAQQMAEQCAPEPRRSRRHRDSD